MFEGDLTEGELEIGQVSSMMQNIISAKEVVQNTWNEFNSLFVSINERS
jgi:enoyl-[acyl-carrier protein] reductase II